MNLIVTDRARRMDYIEENIDFYEFIEALTELGEDIQINHITPEGYDECVSELATYGYLLENVDPTSPISIHRYNSNDLLGVNNLTTGNLTFITQNKEVPTIEDHYTFNGRVLKHMISFKKTKQIEKPIKVYTTYTIEENCDAKEVLNNFAISGDLVNEKNKPVRKIHNNKTEQHIYVDLTDVMFKDSLGKIRDNYHPIMNITTKENIQYYNSYFKGKKDYSRGDKNISEHTKISYMDHGNNDRRTREAIDENSLDYCKENTKSFYISSTSCYGGFYDEKGNNLFDIVKKQIKKGKQNCIGFVSLTKQQWPNSLNNVVSENLETDIRTTTAGQAFGMMWFNGFQTMQGDPLDKNII